MIIVFSGTGNSLAVAAELSRLLGHCITRIDAETPQHIDIAHDKSVIWVFPVYSWGVPPVVRQFMRQVELVGETPTEASHFMVCTCGDDVGLTHEQWRSDVRRRGWRAVGCFSVQMPNTYVLLPGFDVDSPLVAEQKMVAMPERVAAVARAIRHGARVDDVVRGSVAWLKTRVLYPLFVRFMMSPRPFRVDAERCISCGACERACPMDNIALSPQRRLPQWGDRCAMCLGCYHVCPRHAVCYGRRTAHKGQSYTASSR